MMKSRRGFSLVELLVYAGIFAVVTGVLTGILVVGTKTQTQEKASTEVNQQLSLILTTVERLVRQSSLIEKVYEGTDEGVACTTFCSIKLRMSDSSLDPTVIRSDANGVYLKQGAGQEATLTTSRVVINSLRFTKYEIAGAHATVQIDVTLTYNSSNPQLAISRSLQSAVARASAATFDADLLPNTDNTYSVGQLAPDLRWKNGRLSGDLTVAGNVGIGTTSPTGVLTVASGRLQVTGSAFPTGGTGLEIGHNGTSGFIASVNRGTSAYKDLQIAADTTVFTSSFTEKMRLNSTGFGIGTTGPDRSLDVLHASNPQLRLTQTDGTVYADFQTTSSGDLAINVDGVSNQLVLDDGGGIGIGTATPQSKIHIEGASGWIIQDEQDANATSTQLDANDSIAIYNKANKLVIAFNNAGVITYLTIPLDGSTTTWTQSTTAP